jgi:hypothetical protein
MVAHSLHRHSESLVNAFERVALRTVQEIMKHQYSPSGPALGVTRENYRSKLGCHCHILPQLQNSRLHQHTLSTSWVVILEITSSSTSHPRIFHLDIYARTYWTTPIRHVQGIRQSEGLLGQMLRSKHGWLSTLPSRAMKTRPRKSHCRSDQRNLEGSVWHIAKTEENRLL